ncbi:type II toxin-antitoxin system HicA family toxin [Actinomyces bovis]|uniref:type II toxin-antitoxin system HicA family toxin n=1 Tax=Actinomyces bovis TaxID=1658 RepID=UPI000DD05CFC|nr:type II toxin-antitoxin system HicA family toxin [Actinomyces bovis]
MKAQKYRDVVKVLRAQGWVLLRTAKGDHEVWGPPGGPANVTIAHHREVSAGVLRQVAKQLPAIPDNWQ